MKRKDLMNLLDNLDEKEVDNLESESNNEEELKAEDAEQLLKDLGLSVDEVELPTEELKSETREEVKKNLDDIIYGEGEENMNNVTFMQALLGSREFRVYQMAIKGSDIIRTIQGELGCKVLPHKIDARRFYNTYLESNKDFTPEEKKALELEYFPSIAQFANGAKTEVLLIAEFNRIQKSSESDKFLWTSKPTITDLGEISSEKTVFFGSKQFIPMMERFPMDRYTVDNSSVLVYLSTLHVVLRHLGLSVDFLKENKIQVSIGTMSQVEEDGMVGSSFDYVVEFTKL